MIRKRKRKPPRRRLNQPPKRTRQLIESRWRYLEGFRAYCRRLREEDILSYYKVERLEG